MKSKPRKPRLKARLYHVSFLDKGAEILVTPPTASASLFSGGLLVKHGGRQIAYIPNIHSFWELGAVAFQPTTLGKSQAELDKELKVQPIRTKFVYGPSQPLAKIGAYQPDVDLLDAFSYTVSSVSSVK